MYLFAIVDIFIDKNLSCQYENNTIRRMRLPRKTCACWLYTVFTHHCVPIECYFFVYSMRTRNGSCTTRWRNLDGNFYFSNWQLSKYLILMTKNHLKTIINWYLSVVRDPIFDIFVFHTIILAWKYETKQEIIK